MESRTKTKQKKAEGGQLNAGCEMCQVCLSEEKTGYLAGLLELRAPLPGLGEDGAHGAL